MKFVFRKLLSLVLTLVLVCQMGVTVQAAPSRKPATVKYLSAVALIEASDDTEADKLMTELKKEENGAFEDYIRLDLNKGGKKMYLVYKTSTNVDDAITDLSVMNMNGDFSMGSYEQLLSDTMERYFAIAADYRIVAAEFKKNYEAGNRNALTAYRQMNYYFVEKDGVKTCTGMGDYLLNFPADNAEFAKILFSGNLNIIANLKALMAMGITGGEVSLVQRITESYRKAAEDESVYGEAAYEEAAKVLAEQMRDLKTQLDNSDAELAKIQQMELTDEEKEDLTTVFQQDLDMAKSYLEMLKEIPMGDTTLGDYVMNTPILENKTFFPIVAAGSQAEILLMEYGSFYNLMLYDELSLGGEALDEALQELEKDYVAVSVYHGVQNDLVAGTIGVTGDAEFLASATGERFITGDQSSNTLVTALKTVGLSAMGMAGVAGIVGGIAYMNVKNAAAQIAYAPLKEALVQAKNMMSNYQNGLTAYCDMYWRAAQQWGVAKADKIYSGQFQFYTNKIVSAQTEIDIASANLASANPGLTAGQMLLGGAMITLGLVVMGISIWQIVELYNEHEPTYTEIPNNMVHVVSDSVNGDRFVNYINVPAYYYKDGVLSTRENDLNAYKGKQWVSLYYTKNYEAGPCLTATADLIATEAARSGYTGLRLFGHSSNYNLNSHCNRENAEAVYLAFKYSTNSKSAVTDVPDVVGSSFSGGMLAIAGFGGLGVGMGLMALIVKVKKEKKTKTQ